MRGNVTVVAVGTYAFLSTALCQAKPLSPSCGPDSATFDVHRSEQPAEPKAESGTAVLYVITELRYGGIVVGCQANTRVGVDGKWLGCELWNFLPGREYRAR